MQELKALKPWVTVTLGNAPLATNGEMEVLTSWWDKNASTRAKKWRSRPGNYQLMSKQGDLSLQQATGDVFPK